MAPTTSQNPVGSPLWWLKRLQGRLDDRRPYFELMSKYYVGDHALPTPHERAREGFRRFLVQSRANWTGLVVDAVAERLHVEGFRVADDAADSDAWSYWQRNQLDAESELVHVEGLVNGETYVSVWNNPDDPEVPLITPEHPCQMVHEDDPENRRRMAAAAKFYKDDWTGDDHAVLYLPDAIHKYRRRGQTTWQAREEILDNPLGQVPIVVFRNRARLLDGGRSEIEDCIPIQDRINKTLFDRLMASEYSSFRQRWAIGLEIPLDDNGNPREPFKAAHDRLWVAEDPDTKFGEFSATDLEPYIKAVESDVQHMAAISRTPPHYLLGEIVNISGDALKAAETGLSSKAGARARQYGEAWEKVIRLAFAVLDDPRSKVADAETIWRDVETRTEGELVDALVKMQTLGVPKAALWERWGATPQEIERWQDQAFEEALTAATASSAPTPPTAPAAAAAGAEEGI